MTRKVLFACTYNATRSPMAQALCQMLADEGVIPKVEASSAGVYTDAPLDPMAVEAMAELGADITGHAPHSFADIELEGGDLAAFDLVVALSSAAHRRAAEYLRDTETPIEFWGVDDATAAEGSEEARRKAYRAARDALAARIRGRFSVERAQAAI